MQRPKSLAEFDRRIVTMSDLPDEIAIETVMGCNLRCPMCPVTGGPAAMNGRSTVLMKEDVYRRILSEIADRPRSVLLTIIGEPLLHPKIVEYVNLAKSGGHHVGLITNGTRLTPSLATALIDAGLDVLIMSVDGLSKRTYESLRVGARHEVVFSNLRGLIEENARRGLPLRIEINYIVSSRTEAEQDDFFREFAPLVSRINFNPIADFGGQFVPPESLLTNGGDPRAISSRLPVAQRLPCIYLWRSMFVSAEGRLMLCCNDFKLESALPGVMDRPLREIWHREMEQHRHNHVRRSFESEPCRSCRVNALSDPLPTSAAARIRRVARRIRPVFSSTPVGHLDLPVADSTLRGATSIRGWVFAAGGPIRRVGIRVDGVEMGDADWGYYRPDVGEMYPGGERSFSGFDYTLDTRRLTDGAHTLDIAVTGVDSRAVSLGTRTITVRNAVEVSFDA